MVVLTVVSVPLVVAVVVAPLRMHIGEGQLLRVLKRFFTRLLQSLGSSLKTSDYWGLGFRVWLLNR